MPKIQPYESQIVGNGIQDYQVKSTASEYQGIADFGKGLEQSGSQVGAAVENFQARKQAIDGSAGFSNLKADQIGRLSNMNESFNPEDPAAQENFLKDYDAKSEALKANISNPRALEYVSKRIDTYRDALWQQALHKNASLQAKEVGGQVMNFQSTTTANAYVDPDNLKDHLADVDHFVGTLPDKMGSGAKDELKQQMYRAVNISAMNGQIKQNPDKALQLINSGKVDLSGNDLKDAQNRAESQIRMRDRDAEMQDRKAQTIKKQTQVQQYQDYYADLDSGKLSYQDINNAMALEKITPEQKTALVARLDSHIDGTAEGDPNSVMDAMQRLRLPDGDPNKITDFEQLTSQYNQGKGRGIDKQSLQMMARMYLAPPGTNKADTAAFNKLVDDAAKKLIQPSAIPWGDRQGMSNWAKAMNAMHEDYQTKMSSGKYQSSDLLDPNSKDYIGKSISSFQRSRSDMSAQATYIVHGGKASVTSGNIPSPPVGSNPQMTPVQTQPQGGFSAQQMEILKSIGPTKGKK